MIKPLEIYERLEAAYGSPLWWSDDPVTVMIEAVLVQNTKWSKVRQTVGANPELVQPAQLIAMDLEDLMAMIRPCGFHKAKARTIQALMSWYGQYGFDSTGVKALGQDVLRHQLLAIRGIGEETADVILVYAFHKQSFIIDAYTRRLFERLGISPAQDSVLRRFFEERLPRDYRFYGSLHWLILDHSIQVCKRRPLCSDCSLQGECSHGQKQLNP